MTEVDNDVLDTDVDTNDLPDEIADLDLSVPDSELKLAAEEAGDESGKNDNQAESDQGTKKPEEETNDQAEGDKSSEQSEVDPSAMSDKERNAYFAQRRIAAKERNQEFIGSLHQKVSKDILESAKGDNLGLMSEEELRELYDQDPDEATRIARQQEMILDMEQRTRQLEAEREIERIERARESLGNQIVAAESQIPIFNETSSEYQPKLHKQVLQDYATAYAEFVQTDDGLEIVGIKPGAPTIGDYMKERHEAIKDLIDRSEARGQSRRASAEQAAALTSAQGSSYEPGSLEDLEDRIGDVPLDS